MAESHPSEPSLLAYVEEELAPAEQQGVAEHLAACPACAEQVRLLAVGRDALRTAPLLEPPEELRRETIASLPKRRDPWRLLRPLRRPLLVAAPAAAAAALVAVVIVAGLPGGDGGSDDAEEGAAAEMMADEAGEARDDAADGAEAEEEATSLVAGDLVRSVAGPPAEVVRVLELEGIEAELVEGAVVAAAPASEVRAALAGRPAGPVDVYVR